VPSAEIAAAVIDLISFMLGPWTPTATGFYLLFHFESSILSFIFCFYLNEIKILLKPIKAHIFKLNSDGVSRY
jgi:hypothetical protein